MWTAIKGIDIGQEESGLALGYEKRAVFRKIVLPQAAQQFLESGHGSGARQAALHFGGIRDVNEAPSLASSHGLSQIVRKPLRLIMQQRMTY